MNRSVLKKCLPHGLRKWIRNFLLAEEYQARANILRQLPQVSLTERHVRNCSALLNRAAMLSKLEKGGVLAELGVNQGEFSQQILEIAQPGKLHLVDTWASERYHDGLFNSVTEKFRRQIDQGQIEIHRKLSTEAAADFADGTFDCVYIDTNHTYETTREELEKYAPKLKPGGILSGHDYVQGNWARSYRYGVIEAVHEFCVAKDWELVYITLDVTESPSFAIRKIQAD